VAEQVDGAVRGVVAEEAQQIVCTLRGDLCAARKFASSAAPMIAQKEL
jgi:hypothetical protein